MWHPVYDEMKKEERKQMADFKVRCVENKKAINHRYFEVNKCYEVKDGEITSNTGYVFRAWSFEDKSFKSLKDWFDVDGIKFELVEDELQQFTKDMLKTGMRVVLRNGGVYVILKDIDTVCYKHQDIFLARPGTFMVGSDYSNDLTEIHYNNSKYDIVTVFDAPGENWLLDVNKKGKLLWQRPEPMYYTIEEAEAALTEVEGREVKIGG